VFLKFTASGELLFEGRNNFRDFKLVVEGGRNLLNAVRKATAGKAEVLDPETAWIFQDALRRWPSVEQDAVWQRNFSVMIEKARPQGWIDDERKAIKAHIEWVA